MSSGDQLGLEHQLCFALYAATNAIVRSYRAPLAEVGLTYPQYLVLIALLEKPSMTSGELARALRLDAGTLTPMLKRLSAAGMIERTRRVDDERVIDNQLTAKGLARRPDLQRAQDSVVCRSQLAPEELESLRGKLQELTSHLNMVPEAVPEEVLEPAWTLRRRQ